MANAQHARSMTFEQGKECRKCGAFKPFTEFYRHSAMPDGTVNKCKECTKADVRANRASKADYYRAYDRKRYRDDPERAAHCHAAGRTTPMAQRIEKQRERRAADPQKYKARNAVANALRKGEIERKPCFFCGSEKCLEAHHHDYALPLDVYWLCKTCHGKLHTIAGDLRRAV